MYYNVETKISKDSLENLSPLIGSMVDFYCSKIFDPKINHGCQHSLAYLVVLKKNDHEIAIYNDVVEVIPKAYLCQPVVISDSMAITDLKSITGDVEDMYSVFGHPSVKHQLQKLSLIRDVVTWKTEVSNELDHWIWTTDIGIKFYFENLTLLIMLNDLHEGLMEIWLGDSKDVINNKNVFNDSYCFDLKELISIDRKEIDLHKLL